MVNLLLFIIVALNTRISQSTKKSPFEIVFGQHPNTLERFDFCDENEILNEEDISQLVDTTTDTNVPQINTSTVTTVPQSAVDTTNVLLPNCSTGIQCNSGPVEVLSPASLVYNSSSPASDCRTPTLTLKLQNKPAKLRINTSLNLHPVNSTSKPKCKSVFTIRF